MPIKAQPGSEVAGGGNGPYNPEMAAIAALNDRVGKLEVGLGRIETGIEGIRHAQNLGVAFITVAVAIVALVVAVGVFELQKIGGDIGATNARLDRQLEQQAAAAGAAQAAANARMDRLLELYARQGSTAPVVPNLPPARSGDGQPAETGR